MKIPEGEENRELSNELCGIVESLNQEPQPENSPVSGVKAFGLHKFNGRWTFGYYIGLDYLDEDNIHPVWVQSKFEGLDCWAMFKKCLEHHETNRYMPKAYDIRYKKPWIEIGAEKSRDFLILILYHYASLLKSLVKRQLVKSYVNRTENLKGKIKGKIMLARHFKKNAANNRHDRMYCSFDEYTVDCPANRLLHSAIKICMKYGKRIENKLLYKEFSYIESYFQNIGYITGSAELSKAKTNSLFFEYKEALRIANIIYRLKSYSEDSKSEKMTLKIPPFVIDMPMLFELYAFAKMKDARLDVTYQRHGHYGAVDFLIHDERNPIIVDAKYKKNYMDDKYVIDDIRQVAGYARDIRILDELYGKKNEGRYEMVPQCLIISPKPGNRNEEIILDEKTPIYQFNKFYKYALSVPQKDGNNKEKEFSHV